MSNIFEALDESHITTTTSAQLMMCILVDASYSMYDDNRIGMVNAGIREFLRTGSEDIYACDSLDVCLITFGGKGGKVIQEFSNIQSIRFNDIVPNGGTPLASAIDLALEKIDARNRYWNSCGNPHYKPWFIILSDGRSDQSIDRQVEEVQKRYKENKLKGKCIGVGDGSETEDLRRLSPDGSVETMEALQIKDFFSLLSKAAHSLSISTPDIEDSNAVIVV